MAGHREPQVINNQKMQLKLHNFLSTVHLPILTFLCLNILLKCTVGAYTSQ